LLYCNEPFFIDIDRGTSVGLVRENLQVPRPEFKSVEEEVLYDNISTSIVNARRQKILNLSQKISELDRAVKLPKDLKEEYQAKQKSLDQMRHKLADRHVEFLVRSPYQGMGTDADATSKVVENEALKALRNLPEKQVEPFINSWKASLVDGGARQTFVTYVAFLNLYGADHPLVKSREEFLKPYRESFQSRLSSAKILPKEETVDFLYEILKPHSSLLSSPIQAKLHQVRLLEESLMEVGDNARETSLILRKIDFQKRILWELLQKEGLNLDGKDLSDPSMEEGIYQWLNQKKESGIHLGWPLGERGKILYEFDQFNDSSVGLQAIHTESLLALCKARVQTPSEEMISLECLEGEGFQIRMEGFLLPIVKEGQIVEQGAILATLHKDKSIKIRVINPKEGNQPVDLLSFF